MPYLLLSCSSRSRPAAAPIETQSYAQAIGQICDVDRVAGIDGQTEELERAEKRYDYIVENTKNSDAIYFVTIWRTKPPTEQANLLDAEARSAHLDSCALAEKLRAP